MPTTSTDQLRLRKSLQVPLSILAVSLILFSAIVTTEHLIKSYSGTPEPGDFREAQTQLERGNTRPLAAYIFAVYSSKMSSR